MRISKQLSKKIKLLLVYELPNGNMPIAEVRDPRLLWEAKEAALEETRIGLAFVGSIDPIIRIDKEYDLRKKAKILNRLIPDRG